ncbi:MAG: nickel-dependent lactate racemase, partial [Planctomycetota bacterium]|nr:nickel-dependent lactate racemase [Planctomycetota bacterium]
YGVGKQWLQVTARNFLEVIEPKLPPVCDTPSTSLVEMALQNLRLSERGIKQGTKMTIVVPDVTRYCAAEVIVPALVDNLGAVGVRGSDMRVVFANGIHRKLSETEKRTLVGDYVYGSIPCTDHDADAPCVRIGALADGQDVEVNSQVASADVVIVLGAISIHYLAGFGGGAKCIFPGVASRRTILGLHRRSLATEPGIGRHPQVRAGVVRGNPFREAIDAAGDLVPNALAVNTVHSPDRRVLRVFAGKLREAFADAVDFFSSVYVRACREYANMVVVSCGGFPRDINLIQAHKAMDHASYVLEDGGVMLVLARCQDGLGSPDMEKWFRHRDLASLESALREDFEVYGQTAYAIRQKSARFKIVLLSELPRDVVERAGLIPISSLEELNGVVEDFVSRYPKVYVIPDGGSVLPQVVGPTVG